MLFLLWVRVGLPKYFILLFLTSQSTLSIEFIVQNLQPNNYQATKIFMKKENQHQIYIPFQDTKETQTCNVCSLSKPQSLLKLCQCKQQIFVHEHCLDTFLEKQHTNNRFHLIEKLKVRTGTFYERKCQFCDQSFKYISDQKEQIPKRQIKKIVLWILLLIVWNVCCWLFLVKVHESIEVHAQIFILVAFILIPDYCFLDMEVHRCLEARKLCNSEINQRIWKGQSFCRICFSNEQKLEKICNCKVPFSFVHRKCFQDQIFQEKQKNPLKIKIEQNSLESYYECKCQEKIQFEERRSCSVKANGRRLLLSLCLWFLGCCISFGICVGKDVNEALIFHSIGYIFPCVVGIVCFRWMLWEERIRIRKE